MSRFIYHKIKLQQSKMKVQILFSLIVLISNIFSFIDGFKLSVKKIQATRLFSNDNIIAEVTYIKSLDLYYIILNKYFQFSLPPST